MEGKILRDLYCFQCSYQFDKKSIYDMHQLLVHNYKEKPGFQTEIKIEPEETDLTHELDTNLGDLTENQSLNENSSKQLIPNEPIEFDSKKKRTFYCNICENSFSRKHSLKAHKASVHENEKPFKCSTCDAQFSQKGYLKVHISSSQM